MEGLHAQAHPRGVDRPDTRRVRQPSGSGRLDGAASGRGRRVAPANDTPPLDPENIVSIASNSRDHTTLVAALRAADYVTGVANPGPLTVFAPTNAAFAALPAGTVDNLLKPENVADLRHVLQHHVAPAVYLADSFTDGQRLGMVDGTAVTMHIRDGQPMLEDAKVIASIRASNGIIHVIDKVLVPAAPAH